jgi:predicted amidohydrolase YtcJ
VNSRALEAIGVTEDTSDPHGGRIQRDPVTNEPLGVCQEDAAIEMAWKQTPYSDEEIESGLRYAAKYLNSLGITSVQYAIAKRDSNDPYGSLEAYRKLNESGELTLRSVLALCITWSRRATPRLFPQEIVEVG